MYRPSFPKALSKYYFSHIYICSWTRKIRNYLLIHRHFSLSTLTIELFSEEIKRGHRLITLGSTKHTILESLIVHKDCSYNLWRPAFAHNLLPLLSGFWHKLTLFVCKGSSRLPQPPILGRRNWQSSRWTALMPSVFGEGVVTVVNVSPGGGG